MCSYNKNIKKLSFLVCLVLYDIASALSFSKTRRNLFKSNTIEGSKKHLIKIESGSIFEENGVVMHTKLPTTLKPHLFHYKPEVVGDSNIISSIDRYNVTSVDNSTTVVSNSTSVNKNSSTLIKPSPSKKSYKSQIKINVGNKREAVKKQNTYNRPSFLGSVFLYLITLIVAGSLFVMLACFMHKWKETMGNNTNYPKVEYSMLRQGEDEPEDPMGEILVNIGLALPEDIHPNSETESETDDSKIHSFDVPSLLHERIKSEFTTIPLNHEEDTVRLLLKPSGEESDEELLQ